MLLKKLLLIFTLLLCCNIDAYATITYIAEVVDKGNDDKGDVDVPSSVQTDDVMLVQVTIRDSGGSDGVSAPNGWNQIGSQLKDDDVFHSIYYRVAIHGEANTNYEWDFDGNGSRRYIIGMTIFRGVDSSNPIDTQASQMGMNGDDITAPSVTTSNENSMLVGFYSLEAGNGNFSPAAGMAEIYDEETSNNSNGLTTMAAYELQYFIGSSGDKVAEASKSNDDAIGHLVALNEDSSSFIPMSCTASLPAVVFSDNFSSVNNGWQAIDFDRSTSNWPGDNIVNTSGEKQYIDFSISGNELSIDGENEYGMVGIDLSAENINKTFVNEYVLSVDVTANKSGNNNDVGLIFGYVNDNNYYLARWTKYGTSYSNNSSFPGVYRRLELVKIASGSATIMASLDNFNPSDPFNLKVVVNDQGSLVCINNNELLYSATEQPILNNIGLYSYDNDLGVSLDNVEVRCDDCAASALLAYYAMDDASWSGAAGEVIDETGHFNAQSKNGAATSQSTPAIVGSPGTCGYGEFDGVNDYIALPASFDNQQSSFTITAWIKPSNLDSGSRILADDENNTRGYAFSLGDPGSGKLRFYSRGVSPISVDTLASVIPVDAWTFVAAVHNSNTKTRAIYVNGVAQTITGGGLSNTYSGTWGVDTGIASIGGETDLGEIANRFTGALDEVRMYEDALTGTEINAIYAETHDCNTEVIDHFDIIHDGNGLTCDVETVTIKACADTSCTTLNHDATDVQLLINGTVNKTVTVVGSTDTTFTYTTAGIATLSLDQAYECKNGTLTNCDMTFADTGFRFFADTEGIPIPMQLSGKPSGIGFNDGTLKVQAIERNPDSGACQAAFIDSNTIEMVATCVDPTTCAGSQITINNLSTDFPIDTLNSAASKTYTDVALDFSNETVNSAEFIFTYPDAGKVQLHARYNIRDENGNQTGNYMEGSSNAFVVRPFGFYINVADNPQAQTANQINSAFKKAGENFTTSLTAVQWQAADDSDENGVPDTGADLSDNTATVNFGNEITTETAKITDSLYLPDPGSEGNLTNDSFTNFSNGVATNGVNNGKSMTYDEVGIVNFTANLTSGSYLGADNITGVEPYVGRFIPHHFELSTGFDGNIISVCDITSPSSETVFAYIGQVSSIDDTKGALQYESLLQPELLITAKTSICPGNNCTTTQNYTGDFIKLSPDDIEYIIPFEDAEPNKIGTQGVAIKLLADISEGTLPEEVNGIITYTFNVNDNFVYTHEQNAEIPPFISRIELGISRVKDSDDVLAIDSDDDVDNNRLWALNPAGPEIRFGRAYLANSFGPETSDLPQPFSVQYLKTVGNYITNEQDTCTDFNATNLTLENGTLNKNLVNIETATGSFDDELPNGETRAMKLSIIPPKSGKQGTVKVEYEIYSWLKYHWDWNGVEAKVFDKNPTATATFGRFRGNDRIIYQREVIN